MMAQMGGAGHPRMPQHPGNYPPGMPHSQQRFMGPMGPQGLGGQPSQLPPGLGQGPIPPGSEETMKEEDKDLDDLLGGYM